MKKLAYSVPEAAQMIGLGRTKMFELIATGEVASIKVGRRTLVPIESLRNFVENLPSVDT